MISGSLGSGSSRFQSARYSGREHAMPQKSKLGARTVMHRSAPHLSRRSSAVCPPDMEREILRLCICLRDDAEEIFARSAQRFAKRRHYIQIEDGVAVGFGAL